MLLCSWLFRWRTLVAKMSAPCHLPPQSPGIQRGGRRRQVLLLPGALLCCGSQESAPMIYIFFWEKVYVPIFPFVFSGLTPKFLSRLHFCLCVCTCRSQKTVWCCSNSDTTHFGFSDGVSYWPRVLWVRLGWVTSKPQVPACLCLPDLGIIDMYHQ